MIVKFPYADSKSVDLRVVGKDATAAITHDIHPATGQPGVPSVRVGSAAKLSHSQSSTAHPPNQTAVKSPAIQMAEQLAAQAAATKQLTGSINQLKSSITGATASQQQMLIEMRSLAIELAAAIATKICHEKIDSWTYPIESVVESLLNQMVPSTDVVVYLHPTDLELVKENCTDNAALAETAFQADSQLNRGECRASSIDGGLISTIDLQTAELRQQLLEGVNDVWS